jgi:hypothetical protein
MGIVFIVLIALTVGFIAGCLFTSWSSKPRTNGKTKEALPAGTFILIRGGYQDTKKMAAKLFKDDFVSEAGSFQNSLNTYMPDEVKGLIENVFCYWSSIFSSIDIPALLDRLEKQLYNRKQDNKSLILGFDDNLPANVFNTLSSVADVIITHDIGNDCFTIDKCPDALKALIEKATGGVNDGAS